MDRFSEQLVKKIPTGRDMLIRGLYVAAAIVLLFLIVFFVAGFGLIIPAVALAAGVIWGLVWLLQGSSVEYEYIVTNDDLDIDKIIGRRKRKRLITVSLKSASSVEPYDSGKEIDSDVVVMAHDESGEDMYCLLSKSEKNGVVAVIFNPDDRTLYNMIGGFSPAVKNTYSKKYEKLNERYEKSIEIMGESEDQEEPTEPDNKETVSAEDENMED